MKLKDYFSRPERWCKGSFSPDGGKCLISAMVECGVPVEETRLRALKHIYGADGMHKNLCQWNDDPERTYEEVKALVEELDI